MSFIDTAKALIRQDEVKEASTDFLGDTINGLLGDSVSIGKIIIALASSPFFIRDRIFWAKYECFLNGIYMTDDSRAKFCAKLCEAGKEQENAVRIIDTLDHIDTEMKVRYLINASRSVSAGFVELPDYFRICNAIRSVIQEDLQFLANHIAEEDIEYSDSVQSLLSAGLMYQSVIDSNGNQRYSFTPLGELVDRFSVSYDNVERYPNPKLNVKETELKVSIPAAEWSTFEVASDAEVDEMLDDVFGKE